MNTRDRTLGAAFVLCAIAASGCASCPPREGGTVPMKVVSEERDEWLYEHCKPVKVVEGCSNEVQNAARQAGGNFVEVIYKASGSSTSAVIFACPSMPAAEESLRSTRHDVVACSTR